MHDFLMKVANLRCFFNSIGHIREKNPGDELNSAQKLLSVSLACIVFSLCM